MCCYTFLPRDGAKTFLRQKWICSKNSLGLILLIIKYNHKCEKVLCDSYLDNEYCLQKY